MDHDAGNATVTHQWLTEGVCRHPSRDVCSCTAINADLAASCSKRTIDRMHRPGDKARFRASQPGHHAGRLRRRVRGV